MIGRQALVSGRVQGVGFRNFVQREARKLGVRGYAKNLADGDVEVLAFGDEAAVEELLGFVARGPRWAEVRHCQIVDLGADETAMPVMTGFEIR